MIEHFTSLVPGVTRVEPQLSWSLDDRAIEAPARDLVSPYTADDTRRRLTS
jgi:hypothetical protein